MVVFCNLLLPQFGRRGKDTLWNSLEPTSKSHLWDIKKKQFNCSQGFHFIPHTGLLVSAYLNSLKLSFCFMLITSTTTKITQMNKEWPKHTEITVLWQRFGDQTEVWPEWARSIAFDLQKYFISRVLFWIIDIILFMKYSKFKWNPKLINGYFYSRDLNKIFSSIKSSQRHEGSLKP